MWRWMRRIVLYALATVVLLAGVGTLYQWYGSKQDKKSFYPVGKLYEVKGRKMHLYAGGTGDVTAVFASGWGTPSPYADFSPLYEGLESHVKVAVYDRFGYGFSDSSGGVKRDIDTMTDEIHELLAVSGQKPPYILVSHSLGSLEMIRYAQRFPNEVKALLMIDSGSPEYYAASPGYTAIPLFNRTLRVTGLLRALYQFDGFAEWVNSESNGERLLSDEMKKISKTAMLLKVGDRDMTDEMRQSTNNAKTVVAGPKPLQVPMTVLTADYLGKLSKDAKWQESQAALPSWSVNGKQIIVKDSSHYIHGYQPDVVVGELLELAGVKE
ncbi:alpha/beta hydrolase fold protein [Paenibacillus curdlanolyticus YK9]|uniref:Alpha/beta hydrolase fold protein n=1 Tax=Paenibacillus curdlanolyticus YK9 TaxID=717606 RepID=E0IDJ6_9BACL|nr:alpha/beta hydrolase [Paenibacillus curdlanolyticus]EFM09651.1 alpha/beta hydrolase fold protein [Paenibacillus curdlanolyticus YK9]